VHAIDQDGEPFRVTFTVFPADRNQFIVHVDERQADSPGYPPVANLQAEEDRTMNLPRASVGATTGILGVPVAVGLATPLFGMIVAGVEISVVLAVILTALYGSERNSDRAFRLLRRPVNRAEPPAGNCQRVTVKAAAGDPRSRRGRT
jgi:hypothetical protein